MTLPGPRRGRVSALLPYLIAALVLAAAALAAVMADEWYRRARLTDVRAAVEQELDPYGNAITIALNRRMALLSGLRAFVAVARTSDNFHADFDAYAAGLAGGAPGIRTMQIIENGVIGHTYPLRGNEPAVGHDLTRDPRPEVRLDFLRVARSDRIVLSGPVELVQGGLGLIGRQSVASARGEQIGVVAIVLDLRPIFDDARLTEASGLVLALRDQSGRVFFGPDSVFRFDPVTHDVVLPDRGWTLAAVPAEGWGAASGEGLGVFRGTLASLALLLAVVAWLVASRQAALARAVEERTESLTAANRDLLHQVTQREAAEAQLIHIQKMEGLGRLAGGIAHDFNNILTGILGYVGLLQETIVAGSEARQDLDEIERAARRASALTRQLLTFARRQDVAPTVISLNDLITELDRILQRLIGEDIEMVIDLEPALWAVRADQAQLEQVLTNLVVNARDALTDGGRISIVTRNVQASPTALGLAQGVGARLVDFVRLDVRDTGSGMDEATLAQVFEPFFTTKEPGRGTGLGLAICYGIVKQAAASISIESEPGAGTLVQIHFPRALEPLHREAVVEAPQRVAGDGTVLLVEDEPIVRRLIERALAERGFDVLSADNGEEAIALAVRFQGRLDLLVTDVVMPRIGGRIVAEEALAAHPGLKVLFISGHVDDPRVLQVIQESDAAFLAKPFTARELTDAVQRLLA